LPSSLIQDRRVIVSFASIFAGDAVSKAAVLMTTLIAARALGGDTFGEYLGISAVVFVAAGIWDMGLSTVVTRDVAAGKISMRNALLDVVRLRALVLPIWIVLLAGGFAIVTENDWLSALPLGLFAAASLALGLHMAVNAALRGRLRFGAAASTMAAGRVVTAIATILAFAPATMTGRLTTIAAAQLAGEIVTLVASIVAVLWRDELIKTTRSRLKLRSALPFAANSVLWTAYNRLDIVVLAGLSSVAQLALYAPASRLQDGLTIVPSTLGAIALPLIAASMRRREPVLLFAGRLAAFGAALGLVVTVPLFLFMPFVLIKLLGPDYAGSATSGRILVWFLPFASLAAPLLALLAAEGRGADTTLVYTVAFVVAMTLHLSLDWWWGATGAAVASLCRDPAAACLAILLVRRPHARVRTRSVSSPLM
jgi:O-antigen/teichoic acid export membrane protein